MNIRKAAHYLGLWDTIKVHASVWEIAQSPATYEFIQQLVKTTYRKAVIDTHPDTGGSAEDFIKLKSAYDILLKASVKEYINALHDKDLYTPGSPACLTCKKWSDTLYICSTGICTGLETR